MKALGLGQGGGELRAAIEGVGALARLDLDMLGDDLKALGVGEAGDGLALRLGDLPCPAVLRAAQPKARGVTTPPITLAEAKKGLALTLGVAPEAVEIIIRG